MPGSLSLEDWTAISVRLMLRDDGETKSDVIKELAKEYNVQPRTILNGIERFSQTETFRAPRGPDEGQGGRKRRTTEAEDKKIVKWYEDMQGDPFEVTAKRGRFNIDGGALQKPLEGVREKGVSRLTIYRRVWDSDLWAFRPRNKELYTAEEMATRLFVSSAIFRIAFAFSQNRLRFFKVSLQDPLCTTGVCRSFAQKAVFPIL